MNPTVCCLDPQTLSCTGAGAPRADCSLPMLRAVVHSQRPVRLSFIEFVRVSDSGVLVLGVCTGVCCVYVRVPVSVNQLE